MARHVGAGLVTVKIRTFVVKRASLIELNGGFPVNLSVGPLSQDQSFAMFHFPVAIAESIEDLTVIRIAFPG